MGFSSPSVTLNIPLQNYSSIYRHSTIQSQSVIVEFRKVFCFRKWLAKTKNFNNLSDQLTSCYQPQYEAAQHLNRYYIIKYNCSSGNRETSSPRPVNLLLRQNLYLPISCESCVNQISLGFYSGVVLIQIFFSTLTLFNWDTHILFNKNCEVTCPVFPSYTNRSFVTSTF